MNVMKLLTYPDKIVECAKLAFLCKRLGIEVTNNIKDNFDIAIYWNWNPNQLPDQELIEISNRIKVINIKCTNVLKGFVDKAWGLASGYSITIDPRNSRRYVKKSQLQWKSHTGEIHDGRVCDKPQKPDNKYVYQKLINNTIKNKSGELYQVLRVLIFNENIPYIFINDQTLRFKPHKAKTFVKVIYDKIEYISHEEIKTILKFCKITGVEYAEIDFLRDNKSGLLYAIDINNICGNAFHRLPDSLSEKLKIIEAETFKKEFLS